MRRRGLRLGWSFSWFLIGLDPFGVKDAQRHGVKVKPVCVMKSNWRCSVISDQRPSPQSSPWVRRGGREASVRVVDAVRLGFCVVNGLREEYGEELVRQRQDRQFESLEDFKRRVPLTKDGLRTLAELGALNCFSEHRRAAMWEVEETLHDDLLAKNVVEALAAASASTTSPLMPMTLPERVRADYETMNLTTGPHPMNLLRESLQNIWRAIDLVHARHGSTIQIAGNVICRQRPGTAKGFVFISLEDETGVSNAIVEPDLFERFRLVITEEAFLLIEGEVQNSDNVVLIKARQIRALAHLPAMLTMQAGEQLVGSESHDFH